MTGIDLNDEEWQALMEIAAAKAIGRSMKAKPPEASRLRKLGLVELGANRVPEPTDAGYDALIGHRRRNAKRPSV